LAVDPHQIRAFPDVGWGKLGGDRVICGEQRSELGPTAQVITAIQLQARLTGPLPGTLDGVPMAFVHEHERIPHLIDH
jgi:hypothetical protein